MTVKAPQAPVTAPTTDEQPTSGAMIGHHQMRALSGLLKTHGITTDTAVHEYLTVAMGREIASRKELTTTEAAHLIRDLTDHPPARAANSEVWARLAAPFPAEHIEKLPKTLRRDDSNKGRCNSREYSADGYFCGGWHAAAVHLDYVGHAGIVTRLNEVVGPDGWTFEPYAVDSDGLPIIGRQFYAKLTILGVTKWDLADSFAGPQEAYGDVLRRCAMRFGVGTYLWSKSEAARALAEHADPIPSAPARAPEAVPAPEPTPTDDMAGMTTSELLMHVDSLAMQAGTTYEAFTAKFRTEHGLLSVADLDALEPAQLIPWVRTVRAYIEKTTTPPA